MKKTRFCKNGSAVLLCACAVLLSLCVCTVTSFAEEDTERPTPSDIPDPILSEETRIVYEETHRVVAKVEISSVSTARGMPETEEEPVEETEESTAQSDGISDEGSDASEIPDTTDSSAESTDESDKAPTEIPTAALGAVAAVMLAVTAAALIFRRVPKEKSDNTDRGEG